MLGKNHSLLTQNAPNKMFISLKFMKALQFSFRFVCCYRFAIIKTSIYSRIFNLSYIRSITLKTVLNTNTNIFPF
jgi:hypothetical protein